MDKQPNSVEIERTILGAILFNPDKFVEVSVMLTADDFYTSSNRYIYSAMVSLFSRKEPIEIITVSEYLNDLGQLEAANGRTYLMDLMMSVATAENVKYYAKLLKKSTHAREMVKVCKEIIYQVTEHSDIESGLKLMTDSLKTISQENMQETDKTHAELVQMVLEKIQKDMDSPSGISGILTGLNSVDRMLGGLGSSKLIVIGARPSMGKTALALNFAQGAARNTTKQVLYFSLEMDPEEIAKRALLADAEVSSKRISLQDLAKLHEFSEGISHNLHILDRPSLSLSKLRATLLKYNSEKNGIGVVVIDYLQLMKSESNRRNGNRHLEIGEITRELKQISREYKICIILLSQLSRKVEERQDKTPQLSDLRESGSIEEDADAVGFIYRDDYYNKENSERPGVTDFIIAKQRDGSVGSVPLLFQKDIVKFKEPLMSSVKVY